MNKEFTRWYFGGIGPFSRGELAHGELVMSKDVAVIDRWLQQAFMAGMQAAEPTQRPMLVTQQERAALLDGGAGWLDSVETK